MTPIATYGRTMPPPTAISRIAPIDSETGFAEWCGPGGGAVGGGAVGGAARPTGPLMTPVWARIPLRSGFGQHVPTAPLALGAYVQNCTPLARHVALLAWSPDVDVTKPTVRQ